MNVTAVMRGAGNLIGESTSGRGLRIPCGQTMAYRLLTFPVDAGTRSVVLVHGRVHGMGRESACEMVALKDTDPVTHRVTYSRCSVISTAIDLPDGEYTVTSREGRAAVRREGGLWLADGVWLEKPGRARERDNWGRRRF